MQINDPKNTEDGKYLYAFMSEQGDGKMGIVGLQLPNGEHLPAVFLGKHLIEPLKPYVRNIAALTNKSIKVCRYRYDKTVEVIKK